MQHQRHSLNWAIPIVIILIGISLFLLKDDKKTPPPSDTHADGLTSNHRPPDRLPIAEPEDSSSHLGRKMIDPPPAMPLSDLDVNIEDGSAVSDAPLPDTIDQAEEEQGEAFLAVASSRKTVPQGGALLIGGWKLPNGGRGFALTSPRLRPDAGDDHIEIGALVFSVPPEQLKDPDWQALAANHDSGELGAGIAYDAEALNALRVNHAEAFSKVLAGPRVTTKSGEYATISLAGDNQGVTLAFEVVPGEHEGDIVLGVSVMEYDGVDPTGDP